MAINFSDTQVAFASKSNFELQKSYWLFKIMNAQALVKIGSWAANIGIKLHLPIKTAIKHTIFEQFCGGETIQTCEKAIQNLSKYRIATILDYSVEGANNQAALEHTCTEIIHTIARAKADANISFAVFKITGVAPFEILEKISANTQLTTHENTQWQQAVQRVHRICAEAAAVQQPVFIDAEETWIQPAIDALATEMMQKFNKNAPLIYNTIQLYRHDRLQYLYQTHAHATANGYYLGVKLVRGAYMEKERTRAQNLGYPSPIQPTKAATDHDYDLALHFCIDNIKNTALCAGTHNEQSTQLLINAMAKNNLPPNHPHICFSQLYGMSDNLSYNLTNAHYNVSKYLPYGPISAVLPYLIRRANENTAMAGQMSRELNLIIQERKRRNIA